MRSKFEQYLEPIERAIIANTIGGNFAERDRMEGVEYESSPAEEYDWERIKMLVYEYNGLEKQVNQCLNFNKLNEEEEKMRQSSIKCWENRQQIISTLLRCELPETESGESLNLSRHPDGSPEIKKLLTKPADYTKTIAKSKQALVEGTVQNRKRLYTAQLVANIKEKVASLDLLLAEQGIDPMILSDENQPMTKHLLTKSAKYNALLNDERSLNDQVQNLKKQSFGSGASDPIGYQRNQAKIKDNEERLDGVKKQLLALGWVPRGNGENVLQEDGHNTHPGAFVEPIDHPTAATAATATPALLQKQLQDMEYADQVDLLKLELPEYKENAKKRQKLENHQ